MKLPFCSASLFFRVALAENRPAADSDISGDANASAALLAGDYDAAICEVIKTDAKAPFAYNGRAGLQSDVGMRTESDRSAAS